MTHEIRRIGFIGLGRMGHPMVSNLLRAGFQVKVYDIVPERVAALVDLGALPGISPADAASGVELVISMILDDDALTTVALAPDGVLAGAAPGTIYAEMSTVSPMASARVAEAAEQRQVAYLRAKVSGSIKPATEGTLTIFASGPRDAYDYSLDAFRAMGNRHYYVGPAEEAIYIKLVHSVMIGILAATVGEAFAFGERGGADWSQMIEVVNNSALSSTVLNYKAPLLTARKYDEPQSTVDVAAKDIDLALAAAKHMNMPMPVTALVREYFRVLQAQGDGGLDFFGIVTLFESLAGITPAQNQRSAPAAGT
jgi:2-hydroxy-3-oxopropionate reductase